MGIAVGLSLVALPSFSAMTLYGIDQASHFHSSSAGDFYIQAGSFSSKANAQHLKSNLSNKSSVPVSLHKKNNLYMVFVGPLKSPEEVRTVAQRLQGKSVRTQQVEAMARQQNKVDTVKPIMVLNTYDKDQIAPSLPHGWFVGLGAGWAQPTGTDSTNYVLSGIPGFPQDRYKADDSEGSGIYSILGGYQWQRNSIWFPALSLGLGYSITSPSVKGTIYINDLADSENFGFKYEVLQQLPMVTFKADLYNWNRFMPYVSFGAGVAINKVHKYSDWPIPSATLMDRVDVFRAETTTQFAGSVGAGLDYWIGQKAQLSLGYQYITTGNIRSGLGTGTLVADRLTSKLRLNTVSLQGSYFWD